MKRRYVNALITVLVMSVSFSMTAMAVPEDQNVESLETQKAQVQSQADDVQKQLVGLLVQYDALQQDIEKQKERVSQAQEELKAAEAEEQDQYQAMKKRIRYIYEAGDSSFIETLISADSFTDLINKAEYIQNVHSYDRDQLDKYVKAKEEGQSQRRGGGPEGGSGSRTGRHGADVPGYGKTAGKSSDNA